MYSLFWLSSKAWTMTKIWSKSLLCRLHKVHLWLLIFLCVICEPDWLSGILHDWQSEADTNLLSFWRIETIAHSQCIKASVLNQLGIEPSFSSMINLQMHLQGWSRWNLASTLSQLSNKAEEGYSSREKGDCAYSRVMSETDPLQVMRSQAETEYRANFAALTAGLCHINRIIAGEHWVETGLQGKDEAVRAVNIVY